MAVPQEGKGGDARQQRRRRVDHGSGGDHPVGGQPRPSYESGYHKGGQNGSAAKADAFMRMDNGNYGKGGGRYDGRDGYNGYGRGRGYSDLGKGNKGHRGGRVDYHREDYHRSEFAPPERASPPPPWPASEEQSLKDLLMQVAPQARIAENTSRLSSKASANILSKVLTEAANNSSQEPAAGGASSSSANGGAAGYGAPSHGGSAAKQEDDDETAFMEKWSGLFSRGSPLVDGSLEDPFSDLQRNKVVWKKSGDRAGHRRRYQERKQQKEKDDAAANGYNDNTEADNGADVVYDAWRTQTQWRPQQQRPPPPPADG